MKIYISLPITGHDITRQREHADRVAASLSRMGHRPLTPFDIYAGKTPSYADYLCSDLRALADCEAIYLCEGWRQSRGCRIEHDFAKGMGKTIFYHDDEENDETELFSPDTIGELAEKYAGEYYDGSCATSEDRRIGVSNLARKCRGFIAYLLDTHVLVSKKALRSAAAVSLGLGAAKCRSVSNGKESERKPKSFKSNITTD